MKRLNRKGLQKILLNELKMLTMQPMASGMVGHSPFDHGHNEDHEEKMVVSSHDHGGKGAVSREDCCAAVMCLIECCSCPTTKQALIDCCNDIISGQYDC